MRIFYLSTITTMVVDMCYKLVGEPVQNPGTYFAAYYTFTASINLIAACVNRRHKNNLTGT